MIEETKQAKKSKNHPKKKNKPMIEAEEMLKKKEENAIQAVQIKNNLERIKIEIDMIGDHIRKNNQELDSIKKILKNLKFSIKKIEEDEENENNNNKTFINQKKDEAKEMAFFTVHYTSYFVISEEMRLSKTDTIFKNETKDAKQNAYKKDLEREFAKLQNQHEETIQVSKKIPEEIYSLITKILEVEDDGVKKIKNLIEKYSYKMKLRIAEKFRDIEILKKESEKKLEEMKGEKERKTSEMFSCQSREHILTFEFKKLELNFNQLTEEEKMLKDQLKELQ